jgi:hypothetical protein
LFGFLADAISGVLLSFAWCPEAIRTGSFAFSHAVHLPVAMKPARLPLSRPSAARSANAFHAKPERN